MYAVIFKAEIAKLDDEYALMATRMRELALRDYGCLAFESTTENDREIAISYWSDEEQIRAWKQDPQHLLAQEYGRSKWYRSYEVEVVKILRQYRQS